jgi:adenosylcobyric acid synthase
MRLIEEMSGWPALGLVPHFPDAARLPAEDALALSAPLSRLRGRAGEGAIRIAVPLLPHIANFDDLDPLDGEDDLDIFRVPRGEPLPVCDLVILPGSKATIADLAAFRAEGWDVDLAAHVRRGGRVLGICGGYQMLGRVIADPQGVEGPPSEVAGLGLLDVTTNMTSDKSLVAVSGVSIADGASFAGYEMHVGETSGPDGARPVLRFANGRVDGARSPAGNVAGVYVHGLFADDSQRAALVRGLGGSPAARNYEAGIDDVLDAFAAHLAGCVDLDRILALAT